MRRPCNVHLVSMQFLYSVLRARSPLHQKPVSYVIHLPRRLRRVVVVVEARHGRQLVVVLALGAGLIDGLLAGILLNVLCTTLSIPSSSQTQLCFSVAHP